MINNLPVTDNTFQINKNLGTINYNGFSHSTQSGGQNHKFTEEQLEIAKQLVYFKKNVKAIATAGAGKTTAVSCVAGIIQNEPIMAIMYNKKLAYESRAKLPTVEVYTLHSLAQKIFEINCNTDDGLFSILENDIQPINNQWNLLFIKKLKYLVLDEVQDFTPIMISIINKILNYINNSELRLLILGDARQCIYQYAGADENTLSRSSEIFQVSGEWVSCSLTQTFRLTTPMTKFINDISDGKSKMNSSKTGPHIDYVITDLYKCGPRIFNIINSYLQNGYNFNDFAIISYTVSDRNKKMVMLINYLSKCGFPINYNRKINNDNIGNDEFLAKEKILVSTIHQMKGRERKIVFFFGFDNGYYLYGNQNDIRHVCPNVMYVGLSRASEKCFLFHHYQNDYLPFLKNLTDHVVISGTQISIPEESYINNDIEKVNIMDLIQNIPSLEVRSYYKLFTSEQVQDIKYQIDYSHVIEFQMPDGKSYYEDISYLYGTLIPLSFAHKRNNDNKQLKLLYNLTNLEYEPWLDLFKNNTINNQTLALASNLLSVIKDNLTYSLRQIRHYDWVDEKMIEFIHEQMDILPTGGSFEDVVYYSLHDHGITNKILACSIDYRSEIDQSLIWEFKFTSELTNFHKLQTAIYVAMNMLIYRKNYEGRLFNLKTGEIFKIILSMESAEQLIGKLIARIKNRKIQIFNSSIDREDYEIISKIISNIDTEYYDSLIYCIRYFAEIKEHKGVKHLTDILAGKDETIKVNIIREVEISEEIYNFAALIMCKK